MALAGCWETVDDALLQRPLESECFENALLLGDLALNRARAALKLPPMDMDYGDFSTYSIGDLSEAARCYQAALSLAAAEDERLDTGWHGATIQERLDGDQKCHFCDRIRTLTVVWIKMSFLLTG